jgi:hypothetical protein
MATPPLTPLTTICAFPLSSQYAPLVRILTYPLILMSLAGYLPSGTLLTLYTYCSVSSLHLLAMTAVPTHTPHHAPQILDLDIFPAYYLVVLALIITPCSLSRALSLKPRKKASLTVLIAFVLLVWMGTVCMIIATGPSRRPLSSECVANSGVEGCMPSCVYYTLPMRSGQAPVSTQYPSLFYSHQVAITRTVICVVTAWVVTAFIPSRAQSSPNASQNLETGSKLAPARSRRCSIRTCVTIVAVTAWIVIGELFLHTLPYAEKADAIGQWGPVVAFILVALAVGIRKNDAEPVPTARQVAVGPASSGDCAVGGGAYEGWAVQEAGKGLGVIDNGRWAPTSEEHREQDLGMLTSVNLDITGTGGKTPEVRWD